MIAAANYDTRPEQEEGERTMQATTTADREQELRTLLDQIKAHPERSWTEERKRVGVLQSQLASHEKAKQD